MLLSEVHITSPWLIVCGLGDNTGPTLSQMSADAYQGEYDARASPMSNPQASQEEHDEGLNALVARAGHDSFHRGCGEAGQAAADKPS